MKSAGLGLDAIGILIIAFGTALVSTFIGVFLAYILGPLAVNVSKWYLSVVSTTKLPAPNKTLPQYFIDLQLSVNKFNNDLSETAEVLQKGTSALEKAERQLDFPLKDSIAKMLENMEKTQNLSQHWDEKLVTLNK